MWEVDSSTSPGLLPGLLEERGTADERRPEQNETSRLTEKVIRCAFTVSNRLECGLLDKVYEDALAHELRQTQAGNPMHRQQPLNVSVHPCSSAVSIVLVI
jgi:hypothetical protein